jgi:hypothetical protein
MNKKIKIMALSCKFLRKRKELFALLILADCLVQKTKNNKIVQIASKQTLVSQSKLKPTCPNPKIPNFYPQTTHILYNQQSKAAQSTTQTNTK